MSGGTAGAKMPSKKGRRDQLVELLHTAATLAAELREEFQSWYDNMPENLQNGDRASLISEAADAFEEAESSLKGAADALKGLDW